MATARRDRGKDGIYSAACPCCACIIVEMTRANGHPQAPLVWACVYCGFVLMGLAVPVAPQSVWMNRWLPCLEVRQATEVGR